LAFGLISFGLIFFGLLLPSDFGFIPFGLAWKITMKIPGELPDFLDFRAENRVRVIGFVGRIED
jgi:hypothetical protein